MPDWPDGKWQLLFSFLRYDPALLQKVAERVKPWQLMKSFDYPQAVMLGALKRFWDKYGKMPTSSAVLLPVVEEAQEESDLMAGDQGITEKAHAFCAEVFSIPDEELEKSRNHGEALVREFIIDMEMKPRLAALSDPELSPAELTEELRSIQEDLAELAPMAAEQPAPLDVDATVEQIKQTPDGLSTGWRDLDQRGIYIRPGELTTAAGRLGHCKFNSLLNLSYRWITDGISPVVFASYEMPVPDILLKLLAIQMGSRLKILGLSAYQIRQFLQHGVEGAEVWSTTPELFEEALQTVKGVQERFWPLYVPCLDIDRLVALCRTINQRCDGMGAILIDYLQLVPASGKGRYDRRDIEIAEVCQKLKSMAVELNCPVVAAAQINREGVQGASVPIDKDLDDPAVREALKKRRPQIHQLREADQIGQQSDLVLGLQNLLEDYLGSLSVERRAQMHRTHGPLEITVLKSRFGSPAATELTFYGASGLIVDSGEEGTDG